MDIKDFLKNGENLEKMTKAELVDLYKRVILTTSSTNESDANIETKIVLITPAIAEEMLKKNEGNRKLKPDSIKAYAEDMKNGRWTVTNDGITFDKNGKLTNGQNRLHAIIKSGTSQYFNVMHGVEHNMNMDRGAIRTVSDNIRMFTDLPELFTRGYVVGMFNWMRRIINLEAKSVSGLYDIMKFYEKDFINYASEVGFGHKMKGTKHLTAPVLTASFLAYLNGMNAEELKNVTKTLYSGEYVFSGYNSTKFLPIIKLERSIRDIYNKSHAQRYEIFLRTMFALECVENNTGSRLNNKPSENIVYDFDYNGKKLSDCHNVKIANGTI